MYGAQSQPNKMRIISLIVLLICNIVFILLLPVSLLFAIGPHGPLLEGAMLIIAWSLPVLIPVSIIGSWVLYRQQSYGRAIGLSFLPLLSIVTFTIVGLIGQSF